MRPLYRADMDQVLLTFGFTFVFFDFVQTVWGRVIVRLPAPRRPAGRDADRGRRVLDLPAVPDRPRLRHRAAAVAVSRAQPRRRHGARRRRRRRHGRRARRQCPVALHRHLRCGRRARGARRRGRRAGARPLSRHGHRDPHPRLHRDRDRRHGKPARRLRRQSADRGGRHLRQGLSAEPRAVPDLSGDGRGAPGAAAGPVRRQIYRRVRGAGGHHGEHACNEAGARGGPRRDPGDAGLSVPGDGLSARSGRGNLRLRDLCHEP